MKAAIRQNAKSCGSLGTVSGGAASFSSTISKHITPSIQVVDDGGIDAESGDVLETLAKTLKKYLDALDVTYTEGTKDPVSCSCSLSDEERSSLVAEIKRAELVDVTAAILQVTYPTSSSGVVMLLSSYINITTSYFVAVSKIQTFDKVNSKLERKIRGKGRNRRNSTILPLGMSTLNF